MPDGKTTRIYQELYYKIVTPSFILKSGNEMCKAGVLALYKSVLHMLTGSSSVWQCFRVSYLDRMEKDGHQKSMGLNW